MSANHSRRVPRWLQAVWILFALSFVALLWWEVGGDPATSNVLQLALTLIVAVVTLIWFLADGRWSARLRLGVAGVVAAAFALVFSLFEVTLSGALTPRFDPRFDRAPTWSALDAPATRPRDVDLRPQSAFDFPGFLGPDRDNRIESVHLDPDLDHRPPELLWRQPIGLGLSGFAVRNGFTATLEERDGDELATLYDIDSGALLWSTTLRSDSPFGNPIIGLGPRSTPTIDEGIVYVQSVHGPVFALDGASGDVRWSFEPASITEHPPEALREALAYGRAASPLIVGDRLIVPIGGPADGPWISAAALDKRSGRVLWQGGEHQIGMSTPAVGELSGRRQVLLVEEGWASGLDLATGEPLWEVPWPGETSGNASVSQPVPIPPDRFFLSKGYGVGAALWELQEKGEELEPREIWSSSRVLRTKFTNVAIRDGWIYGLSEGVLECVALETGERAWKRGRYGHGQILLVGEVLVVLTEDGEVVYVAADPTEHRELARFEALEGRTWNPFALSGDRLLVRNAHEAAVYRLPLAK